MNAQNRHESWEDPVGIGLDVVTGALGGRSGCLLMDKHLIVLDEALTAAERKFGEAHLRAHHSLGDADDAHDQADLLAALQLVPLSALRVALRHHSTAVEVADDLGVTVQTLWLRLDGIRADDRILAEELMCAVEWPAVEDVATFSCTVLNLGVEAARLWPLRMTA